MQRFLSLFVFIITALSLQASTLKVCEPYKKDSYGNLHIQYSKDKGEEAKLKACFAALKGFRVAVYFEHPLNLANFYASRLKSQGFKIYNIDEDSQQVTWLWRNGKQIADHWTTETAVRTVIRNTEGKILLVKSKGIPTLLVPGGGVHKGKLARDVAVQNLKEEVGLQTAPKDLKLIALLNRTNVYGFKGLNEVVYIFALDQYEGTPQISADIEKLYWVTPEEMKQGKIDGIKVHPLVGPLVEQAVEATAKKGYMRIPDPTVKKSTPETMMDVELFPAR